MSVTIQHDPDLPTATMEVMITKPLADFDLSEVEAATPRDVDPILASQGFKDLLDEARAILEQEFAADSLTIVQLTGAICRDGNVHRPGIWCVVRETGAVSSAMSPEARKRVAAAAEVIRSNLRLS